MVDYISTLLGVVYVCLCFHFYGSSEHMKAEYLIQCTWRIQYLLACLCER